MVIEVVAVVVAGLVTELIVTDKLVPTFIIEFMSINRELFDWIRQVDAMPGNEQLDDDTDTVIDGGRVIVKNDVDINLFMFLNHTTYLVTAFILLLVITTPYSTIVDGVLIICTILLSAR